MFIQQNAPDVADFLTQMNAGFGKPKAVRVEYQGKIILDVGELDKPEDLTPKTYKQWSKYGQDK